MNLEDILEKTDRRRSEDAERYKNLDEAECMLCHAYGYDKRSLTLNCFYAVEEAVPEVIDLRKCGDDVKALGYYLRICKTCRGALLQHLRQWRDERVARRHL